MIFLLQSCKNLHGKLPYIFNRFMHEACSIHNVKNHTQEILKIQLHNYIEKHRFLVEAVEIIGVPLMNVDEKDHKTKEISESSLPYLSESFNSTESCWFFRPCTQNSTASHLRKWDGMQSTLLFEKGYEAIDDFVAGKELHPLVQTAFQSLERFFSEKAKHQNSLAYLHTGKRTETDIASLLAQHLLSQLLPCSSNYFLNHQLYPDECPCGCGVPINFGLTHLGSPYLFSGYADIVLFPSDKKLFLDADDSSSALFTLKRTLKDDVDDILDEQDGCNNGNEIAVEVESLNGEGTMGQLCKLAISASLCKYKQKKYGEYSQSMLPIVPVFAITKDTFEVVVYDPENDCLFKSDSLHLFEDDFSLRFFSLVDLWLIINHSLFCTPLDDESLLSLRGTCNLKPQLGPDTFEAVVKKSNWFLSPWLRQPFSQLNPFGRYKSSSKYPKEENET